MQQEVDEMLANSLTVEDEEAVQAELRELQAVSTFLHLHGGTPPTVVTARRGGNGTPDRATFSSHGGSYSARSVVRSLSVRTADQVVEAEAESEPEPQPQERERIPVAA